jgi:hypothetical protein
MDVCVFADEVMTVIVRSLIWGVKVEWPGETDVISQEAAYSTKAPVLCTNQCCCPVFIYGSFATSVCAKA